MTPPFHQTLIARAFRKSPVVFSALVLGILLEAIVFADWIVVEHATANPPSFDYTGATMAGSIKTCKYTLAGMTCKDQPQTINGQPNPLYWRQCIKKPYDKQRYYTVTVPFQVACPPESQMVTNPCGGIIIENNCVTGAYTRELIP